MVEWADPDFSALSKPYLSALDSRTHGALRYTPFHRTAHLAMLEFRSRGTLHSKLFEFLKLAFARTAHLAVLERRACHQAYCTGTNWGKDQVRVIPATLRHPAHPHRGRRRPEQGFNRADFPGLTRRYFDHSPPLDRGSGPTPMPTQDAFGKIYALDRFGESFMYPCNTPRPQQTRCRLGDPARHSCRREVKGW